MAKASEEIYLIDGSSYIYRAYHAMGGLSNSKGCPTGAVFGFTNMLNKTMKDKSPKRIAVVFDAVGPTFRHEMYDAYKAQRPRMPDDLQIQIPFIHRIVDAYGLPMLSVAGFEADDIIATIAREAAAKKWKVVVVSGDKDLMQLVGSGVTMWDPQKDLLYDVEAVKKKFGVTPDKLSDLFGLMGDSSDNVPGVRGIGPKTAATLIDEYACIEGVYENLEAITQKKVRENLRVNKENALLSRNLVTLFYETPLQKSIEDLVIVGRKDEELHELFKELEFKKFLDELPPRQNLDFSGYCVIDTIEHLEKWVNKLRKFSIFAVDLETTSTEAMRADLVGLSFCGEDGQACYVPVGHTCGSQLSKDDVFTMVRPLLEDESIKKIGQNIKYDTLVLQREGIRLRGVVCDTMIASYLLDPTRRGHSLEDLAQICLEHKMIPIVDLIGKGKTQSLFSAVDIAQAYTYACEDAEVTFRVANILCPRLETEGLAELYYNIEMPLVPILVDMEMKGMRVDTEYLRSLSTEFAQVLETIEAEIHSISGECFNINSPKQLGEVLFNKLGLKTRKKTKTGLSTSIEVLEDLAHEHELPRKILDYRSIFKLKSTYADALVALVHPQTGRIHTSYNQAVAATGRLSSSDPNLQNIPIRTTEGRKIRRAFIPEDGYVFVAADYSQIELRIMAHVSGDERLLEAFSQGEDIHAITASSVFGLPSALVTDEMRRKAKAINFGIIYGMGAFKLSNQINVEMKLAKRYLEDYYALYSGVKKYMDEIPIQAARNGYVTTILGRKRPLPDINSSNRIAQQAARRVAINTTIQGSAADLMKLAMIKIHKNIEDSGLPAKMILQVHDELMLEVRKEAAYEAAELLKREMEEVYKLSTPLKVDAHIGVNWDEVH